MTYSSESETSEFCQPHLPGVEVKPHDSGLGKAQSKQEKKKIHVCSFTGCSAKFSRPWRLEAHVAFHLGKKPFACDYFECNKAYTSNYHLRRHKLSCHAQVTSEKTYKCHHPGCKKEFKFIQNAKKHFKRTHEEKTCKVCGQQFFKHLQLKKHMKVHTSGFQYKCEQCGQQFLHKFLYRRHQRGHMLHACPLRGCFEVQKNWSLMRKHLATHPKAFVCAYCRKGYRGRKYLKAHIFRHLNGMKMRKPYELKKGICDTCGAELLGKASLKRHMRTMHGNYMKDKPSPKRGEARARRKDKGIPKRALAVILSEVVVSKDVEGELIKACCDLELPSETEEKYYS